MVKSQDGEIVFIQFIKPKRIAALQKLARVWKVELKVSTRTRIDTSVFENAKLVECKQQERQIGRSDKSNIGDSCTLSGSRLSEDFGNVEVRITVTRLTQMMIEQRLSYYQLLQELMGNKIYADIPVLLGHEQYFKRLAQQLAELDIQRQSERNSRQMMEEEQEEDDDDDDDGDERSHQIHDNFYQRQPFLKTSGFKTAQRLTLQRNSFANDDHKANLQRKDDNSDDSKEISNEEKNRIAEEEAGIIVLQKQKNICPSKFDLCQEKQGEQQAEFEEDQQKYQQEKLANEDVHLNQEAQEEAKVTKESVTANKDAKEVNNFNSIVLKNQLDEESVNKSPTKKVYHKTAVQPKQMPIKKGQNALVQIICADSIVYSKKTRQQMKNKQQQQFNQ